jgi:anthranilate synthase component 2
MSKTKIYFIDNFDSFSYNLVDEFEQLGFELVVYRNNVPADTILAKMAQENSPVILVLSPGPGSPSQAGHLIDLIDKTKGLYPMLGICLGHQAIVECYGGQVGHAGEIVHGKSSLIELNEHAIFDGINDTIPVARYHSLMATQVPVSLSVLAEYNAIPMAVCHEADKVIGFQFHPESILTPDGAQLLKQSLSYLTRSEPLCRR